MKREFHNSAKIDSGLLSTFTFSGVKFRSASSDDDLFNDLHSVLGPFVANMRGRIGIIEPTESIVFRPVRQSRRRSHSKSLVDIVMTKQLFNRTPINFGASTISLKESGVFERFLFDIHTMLQSRGLSIPYFPLSELQRDQNLNFWLLNQIFLQPSFNNVAKPGLQVISSDLSEQATKWLNDITELAKKYPFLKHCDSSGKTFKTRRSFAKRSATLQQLSLSLEPITQQCFAQLMYTGPTSTVKTSLLDKQKSLDETWKPVTLTLMNSHLKGGFASVYENLSKMNAPKMKIKVDALWYSYPDGIDSKLVKAVDFFYKLKFIESLHLNLNFSRVTDEGCKEIASFLRTSTTLSTLKIDLST
eukprot:TRINITY_DN4686_c0_g1_i10.p1 TRINITY_DN4686_c0_g1~~TRINITY_DN4686_c0_g1_i10.p1  ORF type:complete len:360 (+),score=40.19 TRINITY_DN4686_c0_g1_i10:74-1153(+)